MRRILRENSLTLVLLALFSISLVGQTVAGYLATSRFWFESFQNWQSELLSIAVIVVRSIFLRERGSPESKPVAAPHDETGGS